jgi:hypothetical protein
VVYSLGKRVDGDYVSLDMGHYDVQNTPAYVNPMTQEVEGEAGTERDDFVNGLPAPGDARNTALYNALVADGRCGAGTEEDE